MLNTGSGNFWSFFSKPQENMPNAVTSPAKPRGRPPKTSKADAPAKRRGRPPKSSKANAPAKASVGKTVARRTDVTKPRGRPPKSQAAGHAAASSTKAGKKAAVAARKTIAAKRKAVPVPARVRRVRVVGEVTSADAKRIMTRAGMLVQSTAARDATRNIANWLIDHVTEKASLVTLSASRQQIKREDIEMGLQSMGCAVFT